MKGVYFLKQQNNWDTKNQVDEKSYQLDRENWEQKGLTKTHEQVSDTLAEGTIERNK